MVRARLAAISVITSGALWAPAAEAEIRQAAPTAQVIYVEPDIFVEGHVPGDRPEVPAPAGH